MVSLRDSQLTNKAKQASGLTTLPMLRTSSASPNERTRSCTHYHPYVVLCFHMFLVEADPLLIPTTEYFAEPDNAPQRGYDQAAFESAWKEVALGKREAIEEEVKTRRAGAPAALKDEWAGARDLIVSG